MAVQVGLCQTLSETPKTGFLASRLNVFMSFRMKTQLSGFPFRSDINRSVQLQKMVKSLKFRREIVLSVHSEKKDADQLCNCWFSYAAAQM